MWKKKPKLNTQEMYTLDTVNLDTRFEILCTTERRK